MNILIPLITPFNKNLQVDYKALNILLNYLENRQILVNSWIGEVYTLTLKEYIDILSRVKNKIDKEVTIYIPSYKYRLDELIDKIVEFYGKAEINDNIMIELDVSDWLCNNELCLSRVLSKTLNKITSTNVMLYVVGQYNAEIIELLRGIVRVYPEITHLVIDQSVSLPLLTRIIDSLDDIDREIELLIFGDYGFIIKNQLVHGIISPFELIRVLLNKKFNVDINNTLFLTRMTSYSYSIIGAIKTATNIIEPAIKEYLRPPFPTEFPGLREHITSILNYLIK